MAHIKGAPVSYQEVKNYKSHFISLFISKASEDTAEVGQDCSQLSQTPKVSQQGTKPTNVMSFTPFAFPASPLWNPKQPSRSRLDKGAFGTSWHGGVLHPCQHPGMQPWGRAAVAGVVWAGLTRDRRAPQRQNSPSLGAATSPPRSLENKQKTPYYFQGLSNLSTLCLEDKSCTQGEKVYF